MKRFAYLLVALVILTSVAPQPAVGMQAVSKLTSLFVKQGATKFGRLNTLFTKANANFGTKKPGPGSIWRVEGDAEENPRYKKQNQKEFSIKKPTVDLPNDKKDLTESLLTQFTSKEDRSITPKKMVPNKMVPLTEVPKTLYRLQTKDPVVLRDYDTQKSKGLTSYDVVLHSGEVVPSKSGELYQGTPNGMSLRPMGTTMMSHLQSFRGDIKVVELPKGTQLPKGLVLFNEYDDHYSLQPSERMSLANFNALLTEFLKPFKSVPRRTFLLELGIPESLLL